MRSTHSKFGVDSRIMPFSVTHCPHFLKNGAPALGTSARKCSPKTYPNHPRPRLYHINVPPIGKNIVGSTPHVYSLDSVQVRWPASVFHKVSTVTSVAMAQASGRHDTSSLHLR